GAAGPGDRTSTQHCVRTTAAAGAFETRPRLARGRPGSAYGPAREAGHADPVPIRAGSGIFFRLGGSSALVFFPAWPRAHVAGSQSGPAARYTPELKGAARS